MTKVTPLEYLQQVIPSHPNHSAISTLFCELHRFVLKITEVGCKRVVYDTNYLPSLARPNLSLVWDPIESINEHGILTKEGM
jgi:cation diffusion facilitator CzcD-associated flavoprotein CzcO